jgi:hypothetical protein
MTFEEFQIILNNRGLKLASMGEYRKPKLVEVADGKERYDYEKVKEIHLISWNVTDLAKVEQYMSWTIEGTWEDAFDEMYQKITGKDSEIQEEEGC